MINPSVPARSVRELLDLARSKPGSLNYSAAGAGTKITAAWIAHELNEVLPADAIVVNETISHSGDLVQLLDKLKPGAFYESS